MPRTLLTAVLILLVLAGCAPAAQPAPTPTPAPSPTSPPPSDLTVIITGEGGAPLEGVEVSLAGLPMNASTDAEGRVEWRDLPSDEVTVAAASQGYAPAETRVALQPGTNEAKVILERVPFGLLPQQACAPGEKPLYIEDFQDGEVTNWGVYPPRSPFTIQADPDEPQNMVLALNFGGQDGEFMINALPLQDGVVRRFKYRPGDHSRFHFNWGTGQEDYFVQLSADQFELMAVHDGQVVPGLARTRPVMQQGVWHLLEVAVVGEKVEVWADGEQRLTYSGPAVTAGQILGFGSAFLPPESIVLIDDVSICSSGGALSSLYSAPE